MNIIGLAFGLKAAVEELQQKAKQFFYSVMLLGRACPKCKGILTMVSEGRCHCDRCGYKFDPTIQFQQCLDCGGKVTLQVRRYHCQQCNRDITSRFLFDGLVFNREYFATRMAESRRCRKERHERVQTLLAESRSNPLRLGEIDLGSSPGLIDALKHLTGDLEEPRQLESKVLFDLNRYQAHIATYLNSEPLNLRDIPSIIDNSRLDLIWRFVALIFLAHYGQVDIQQENGQIRVAKIAAH